MEALRVQGAESAIRERVRFELEQRGWSQEEFAEKVRPDAPMTRQAVKDLLSKDRPRRVKVEELLAFSKVFGVPPLELTRPIGEVIDAHAARLAATVRERALALDDSWRALVEAWIDLAELEGRDDLLEAATARRASVQVDGLFPTFPVDDTRIGADEAASERVARATDDMRDAARRLLSGAGYGTRVADGHVAPIATTWAAYRAWRDETAGLRGETRGPLTEAEWLDDWNMLTGYQHAAAHTYESLWSEEARDA